MRLRCTCPRTDPTSLLVQVGAVEPGLTYSIERSCSTHGAVDEILASGRYTDRRGRSWRPNLGDNWVHFRGRKPRGELFYDALTDPEMRLLIERDQHRDECDELAAECADHPVPVVCRRSGGADWIISGELGGYSTLPKAMDAARALAVGQ